jgi:hypothetical protein
MTIKLSVKFSAQAQKFGISMKKDFIGRPQSGPWCRRNNIQKSYSFFINQKKKKSSKLGYFSIIAQIV